MPTFNSAAAFFRAADGKRVIRRQNIQTLDTWPEVVADARRQLVEKGCPVDQIFENETGLNWPGAFMWKPKVSAVMEGVFTVRSAEYLFLADGTDKPGYGAKKGAKVEGDRLVKTYDDGRVITFEIA